MLALADQNKINAFFIRCTNSRKPVKTSSFRYLRMKIKPSFMKIRPKRLTEISSLKNNPDGKRIAIKSKEIEKRKMISRIKLTILWKNRSNQGRIFLEPRRQ